ncbi:hypothetical protein TWF192_001124 [Orbilia oligospora]|nr:hypothetical protein TWF192_001124 [Orbilia oligospora]
MTSARKKFTYGPPTLHPAPWRQYFVKFVQVDILKEALGQWKLVKWAVDRAFNLRLVAQRSSDIIFVYSDRQRNVVNDEETPIDMKLNSILTESALGFCEP